MSMDRSLKSKASLARHRNVLTRAERVAKLKDVGQWADDRSALGLPKVGNRKAKAGGKKKEKDAAVGADAAKK